MSNPNVALIIPAYNEEATIRGTLQAFHAAHPAAFFCVINNNSQDRTGAIAEATLAELGAKGRVLFEGQQGKGCAVRAAFHAVDADYYVMVDADMTYPADELHLLLKAAVDEDIDMVVGDRLSRGDYYKENKRALNSFGNRLVLAIVRLLFGVQMRDIMSGYRVFSRRFVLNTPLLSLGYEIETEMTIHALDKRFRVKEIPVTYRDRPPGSQSKLHTFRDGYRVLKKIMWIFKCYRPLPFFGSFAALFVVGSFASGAPVLVEFARTNYITHVPLAILATGLMLLAFASLSLGMILDTVAINHRFDFEHRLLLFSGKRD